MDKGQTRSRDYNAMQGNCTPDIPCNHARQGSKSISRIKKLRGEM